MSFASNTPSDNARANNVLSVNDDLPIRSDAPVHSGKVRSVYWLNQADSRRLIEQNNYPVAVDSELAVMVISDRISAFECLWRSASGLDGVPGKGAALNAIAGYWFQRFRDAGVARSHILDIPHPLVWIVQKARPVMIEAIARQYITGSMWRAYEKGERVFCGIQLPDGLLKNQKLPELLITPSTKGVMKGIPGVPEADDVNVSRNDLAANYQAFGFVGEESIARYESLLAQGFDLISERLQAVGQIFVDTKFEFGYVDNGCGGEELIYMDEVGTPDSSRLWDAEEYAAGNIVENSKEGFRQHLLGHFSDPDILLNKSRMDERFALARDNPLPDHIFAEVSAVYIDIAEKITGSKLLVPESPRAEIVDVLANNYGLVQ